MNPPHKQRKAPRSRKLDPKKVLELAQHGVSAVDIAKHQGVAHSTIWRFLRLSAPERQALEDFKSNRADVLARVHAKAIDLKEKVLDSFDDGVLGALKPGQKNGLLVALNLVAGTAFDKERLERGQSTANHSILTKVLNGAIKHVYTPQPVVGEPVVTEAVQVSAQNDERASE